MLSTYEVNTVSSVKTHLVQRCASLRCSSALLLFASPFGFPLYVMISFFLLSSKRTDKPIRTSPTCFEFTPLPSRRYIFPLPQPTLLRATNSDRPDRQRSSQSFAVDPLLRALSPPFFLPFPDLPRKTSLCPRASHNRLSRATTIVGPAILLSPSDYNSYSHSVLPFFFSSYAPTQPVPFSPVISFSASFLHAVSLALLPGPDTVLE